MKHKKIETLNQSVKFSQHTNSSKQVHERSVLEGYWTHRLFAPIQITDTEKFLSLFGNGLNDSEWFAASHNQRASDKTIKKLVRDFHQDKWMMKELDSLLYSGGMKWKEEYQNIIVNEGLDHVLDVLLSGGTQDTSWFVGLLAATPSPLAAWTATEIASNDFVAYDEATLQAFTDGGVLNQSVDNSASPATFTISADSSSIGGAYLIGTNAKGTPAGTVYSAGAFTGGNKAADDDDSLEVTCTFTSADDGA